jgi:hypothetical protein
MREWGPRSDLRIKEMVIQYVVLVLVLVLVNMFAYVTLLWTWLQVIDVVHDAERTEDVQVPAGEVGIPGRTK